MLLQEKNPERRKPNKRLLRELVEEDKIIANGANKNKAYRNL